jgi:predicted glutamate--cysteine ligase
MALAPVSNRSTYRLNLNSRAESKKSKAEQKVFNSTRRSSLELPTLVGSEVELSSYWARLAFFRGEFSTPQFSLAPLAPQIIAEIISQHPEMETQLAIEPWAAFVEGITKPTNNLFEFVADHARVTEKLVRTMLEFGAIPGLTGTIPSGGENKRSKPGDLYHDFIEKTWKENVSTGGHHINIGQLGFETIDMMIRRATFWRLCDFLNAGLSASSPFLRDKGGDIYDQRPLLFPPVPDPMSIPLWASHPDYVTWFNSNLQQLQKRYPEVPEEKLKRLLWIPARPHGPNRPHKLNRVEQRASSLTLSSLMIEQTILSSCMAVLINRNNFSLKKGLDSLTPERQTELIQRSLENATAQAYFALEASIQNPLEYLLPWFDGIENLTPRKAWQQILTLIDPVMEECGLADQIPTIRGIVSGSKQTVSEQKLAMRGQGMTIAEIETEMSMLFVRDLELLLNRVSGNRNSMADYFAQLREITGEPILFT